MYAEPCNVELQSVGYWESETTYIKLNGEFVLQLMSPVNENDLDNPSGTYTILLDKVASLSYHHHRHFICLKYVITVTMSNTAKRV